MDRSHHSSIAILRLYKGLDNDQYAMIVDFVRTIFYGSVCIVHCPDQRSLWPNVYQFWVSWFPFSVVESKEKRVDVRAPYILIVLTKWT